ncbi:MAG TPA: ABC transporter substrate-binding protein [Acidimicrobiales bacterium]|nr:ABC transporter substrate-binding protein [Acidimicrobiales bacterium]
MNKRIWLVTAGVLALVAAGCAKGSSTSATSPSTTAAGPTTTLAPQNGGTLNIGLDAETDGWDPVTSEWAAAGYFVAQTFFDPLCAYDAAGQAVPYLAKSVTHSANYRTWTIGLRPGIRFSNGQPLNAAAVVLQLTLGKESALVGQALGPMVRAIAVNSLTVKVEMSEPWVAFPAVLASQAGFMAAPAQLESTTASTTQPIGTGPFTFQQWIMDSTLTVVKNPDYWRPGVTHVDKIVFHVITDPTTRLQSLQSGQIQFMYTTEASQIEQLKGQTAESMYVQHLDEPVFIMLNTDAAPLNNLALRLALEYATDQQQLISAIDLGLGSVVTEPYAPGSPWYVPSGYPTAANDTKAEQLVAEYHHETGTSGPVKFTLGCTSAGTNPEAMQLVQAQWQKVGIDVSLSYTEQATYINNAIFGNYQANCWTQFGDIDPDIDATWWLSANAHPNGQPALNFARLSDSTTDAELQIGRTNPSYAVRKAAYGAVWHQFALEAPYIWLGRGPNALVSGPTLHGLGDATLPGGQRQDGLDSDAIVPIDQLWLSS